jgi:hypothetical protein
MRGFRPYRGLAVGVAAVGLLLAAGAPGANAGACYDSYLDALRVDGRCGGSSVNVRKLQVVKPVRQIARSGGTLSTKAM